MPRLVTHTAELAEGEKNKILRRVLKC